MSNDREPQTVLQEFAQRQSAMYAGDELGPVDELARQEAIAAASKARARRDIFTV